MRNTSRKTCSLILTVDLLEAMSSILLLMLLMPSTAAGGGQVGDKLKITLLGGILCRAQAMTTPTTCFLLTLD